MTVLDRYSDAQADALAADAKRRSSRYRDAPYLGPHLESKHSAPPPRGLGQLLLWYRARFTEEIPDAIHGAALWHDYAGRDDPPGYKAQGGSLLGTPAHDDEFRRLLDNKPTELQVSEYDGHKAREGDEHYARPMRAALFRVGGGSEERRKRAQYLMRIAASGFDWYAPAVSMGIPTWAAAVYAEDALYVLWREYSVERVT